MKITDFVSSVTKEEGLKESVKVAQVAEVLKIVNKRLFGIPYLLIKLRRK